MKKKNSKNSFKCRKCGKPYTNELWFGKHVDKCKKKTPPVKAADEGSGRNPDGSFKTGNSVGKGNPHWTKLRRYREDYLAKFREIFTPERMEAVVLAMVHKALQDKDGLAMRTLMEYAMGKPVMKVEDDVEGGPERKAAQIAEALKALEM